VIEQKWVIAGRPINDGKWQCDDFCDWENHHLHTWCSSCQIRLDRMDTQNHGCQYGIGLGQIHPGMDPSALQNQQWWNEPQRVIELDQEFFARKRQHDAIDAEEKQYHYASMQQILDINNRHLAELNGEGTSRTPIIEEQTKPNIGKRFKRY